MIQGRVDGGAGRLTLAYEDGVVTVASADQSVLSFIVDDVVNQDFTSLATLGPLSGVSVEARYDADNKMLRIDASDRPEFWIQIDLSELLPQNTEIIAWRRITKENAILTLWPGTLVYEHNRASILHFFRETFDVDITIVGCVETLPDKDQDGNHVPGTGGRMDFFFYVDFQDVEKFAIRRLRYGMRWWQDVYCNEQQDIYPIQFLQAYPSDPSVFS